jgi:hypothetical protein
MTPVRITFEAPTVGEIIVGIRAFLSTEGGRVVVHPNCHANCIWINDARRGPACNAFLASENDNICSACAHLKGCHR